MKFLGYPTISLQKPALLVKQTDEHFEITIIREEGSYIDSVVTINYMLTPDFEFNSDLMPDMSEKTIFTSELKGVATIRPCESETSLTFNLEQLPLPGVKSRYLLSILPPQGDPLPKLGEIIQTEIELLHDVPNPTLDVKLLPDLNSGIAIKQSEGTVDIPITRIGCTDGYTKARWVTSSEHEQYDKISGTIEFQPNQKRVILSIPLDKNPNHDDKCDFNITITDITGDHYPVLPEDIIMPVTVENDNKFVNVGLVETNLSLKPVKQSDQISKMQIIRTGDLNVSIKVPWKVDSLPEQTGELKFECGQSDGYFNVSLLQVPQLEKSETLTVKLGTPEVIDFPRNRNFKPHCYLTNDRAEILVENDINSPIVLFDKKNLNCNRSQQFVYIPIIRKGFQNSKIEIKAFVVENSGKTPVIINLDFNQTNSNLKVDFDMTPQSSGDEIITVELQTIFGEFWPEIEQNSKTCTITLSNDVARPNCGFTQPNLPSIPHSLGSLRIPVRREGWIASCVNIFWKEVSGNDLLNESQGCVEIASGQFDQYLNIELNKFPTKDKVALKSLCFKIEKIEGDHFPVLSIDETKLDLIYDMPMSGVEFSENSNMSVKQADKKVGLKIVRNGYRRCAVFAVLEIEKSDNDKSDFCKIPDSIIFGPMENETEIFMSISQVPMESATKNYKIVIKRAFSIFDYKGQNFNLLDVQKLQQLDNSDLVEINESKQSVTVNICRSESGPIFKLTSTKMNTKQSNGPFMRLQVTRSGYKDSKAKVCYKIDGEKFELEFLEGETEKWIDVPIDQSVVDDDKLERIVKLTSVEGDFTPKIDNVLRECELTVFNDFEFSEVWFAETEIEVKQSEGKLRMEVVRKGDLRPGLTTLVSGPDLLKELSWQPAEKSSQFFTIDLPKTPQDKKEDTFFFGLTETDCTDIDQISGNTPVARCRNAKCVVRVIYDIQLPKIGFFECESVVNRSEGFALVTITRQGFKDEKLDITVKQDSEKTQELIFQIGETNITLKIELEKKPKDTTQETIMLNVEPDPLRLQLDKTKTTHVITVKNNIFGSEFSVQKAEIKISQSKSANLSIPVSRKGWSENECSLSWELQNTEFSKILTPKCGKIVVKPGENVVNIPLSVSQKPEALTHPCDLCSKIDFVLTSVTGDFTPKITKHNQTRVKIMHDIAETLIGFEIDEMMVKQSEQYIHLPMERRGYSGADTEFTWDVEDCMSKNKEILNFNPMVINEDRQLLFQPGETKLRIPLSISQMPAIEDSVFIDFKLTNSNCNFISNLRKLRVKIVMNVDLPKVSFTSQNFSAKQSDEFAVIILKRTLHLPNAPTDLKLFVNKEPYSVAFKGSELTCEVKIPIDQVPTGGAEDFFKLKLAEPSSGLIINTDETAVLTVSMDYKLTTIGFDCEKLEYLQSDRKCVFPIQRSGDMTTNVFALLKIEESGGKQTVCRDENVSLKFSEFSSFATIDFPKNPLRDNITYQVTFDNVRLQKSEKSNYSPKLGYSKYEKLVIIVSNNVEIPRIGIALDKAKQEFIRSEGEMFIPFYRKGYLDEQAKVFFECTSPKEISGTFSGDITFSPGQDFAQYRIPLSAVPFKESHESLLVNLFGPSSGGESPQPIVPKEHKTMDLKIVNDIPQPFIEIEESSIVYKQSAGIAEFSVRRRGWSKNEVEFDWKIYTTQQKKIPKLYQLLIQNEGVYKIKSHADLVTIQFQLSTIPLNSTEIAEITELQLEIIDLRGPNWPKKSDVPGVIKVELDVFSPMVEFTSNLTKNDENIILLNQSDTLSLDLIRTRFFNTETSCKIKFEHPQFWEKQETTTRLTFSQSQQSLQHGVAISKHPIEASSVETSVFVESVGGEFNPVVGRNKELRIRITPSIQWPTVGFNTTATRISQSAEQAKLMVTRSGYALG